MLHVYLTVVFSGAGPRVHHVFRRAPPSVMVITTGEKMASPVIGTEEEKHEKCDPESDKTARILEDTAKDYAEYILVDPRREKEHLDEKIEEMLTRLDEFCAVVEMIRTDSSLSLTKSLPGIQSKAQEIQSIFTRIDELEKFVGVVRDNVSAMEEEVNDVEKEQGKLHSIKNLLSSLPVFTTKRGTIPKPPKKFTPLEIFNTSNYIKSPQQPNKEEDT